MSQDALLALDAYGQLVLTIAAVVGVFYAFYRWTSKRLAATISGQITEATRQIAPGANGGESLADVARTVKEMHGRQSEILDLFARLEKRLDHSDARAEKFTRETRKTLGVWSRTLKLQGIETPIEEAS